MDFRTELVPKPEPHGSINYHSKVVLLGSCFAEHIGDKLDYHKFQMVQNPFGALFHPLALETSIINAINEKEYEIDDLIESQGLWCSFDAHSRLNSPDEDQVLNNLKLAVNRLHNGLKDATHLIISLGSAWAYRHISSDRLVSNCHKIPQKQFLKELSSVESISESLAGIIQLVKSLNSNIRIVFTISPVRHLKDGFIENNRSKSHLLAAVHDVVDALDKIHYFPSYEYMLDDLRDYRFYKEDLVHPSASAVEYIWQKFVETWFDKDVHDTMKTVDQIQKGIAHKPFHESSKEHVEFLDKLEGKKAVLLEQFPHMQF